MLTGLIHSKHSKSKIVHFGKIPKKQEEFNSLVIICTVREMIGSYDDFSAAYPTPTFGNVTQNFYRSHILQLKGNIFQEVTEKYQKLKKKAGEDLFPKEEQNLPEKDLQSLSLKE